MRDNRLRALALMTYSSHQQQQKQTHGQNNRTSSSRDKEERRGKKRGGNRSETVEIGSDCRLAYISPRIISSSSSSPASFSSATLENLYASAIMHQFANELNFAPSRFRERQSEFGEQRDASRGVLSEWDGDLLRSLPPNSISLWTILAWFSVVLL